MNKSQIILTIMLTTHALSIHGSQNDSKPQCPFSMKLFQNISDNGVKNIEHGWNKIKYTEMSQEKLLKSRPYEVGAIKVLQGATQMLCGATQIVTGDAVNLTLQNPDKALITIITIGSFLYAGNQL